MSGPLGRLAGNIGGSVLPIVALTATVLIGAAALAIDVGLTIVAKRRLQGGVDLAAIVAAQEPSRGDRLARLTFADNGLPVPRALTAEPGRYLADPTVPAAARFRVGESPANAVRVSATMPSALVFGRILTGEREHVLQAQALAAKAETASFSIGSRLASLNGGVANAVLGSLLGTQLSLSVMDYRALAAARLDALKMLDEAAVSADLRGVTYAEALQSRLTLGQTTSALAVAGGQSVGTSGGAAAALAAIAQATRGNGATVALSRAIGLGDLGGGMVGSGGARPLPVGAKSVLDAAAAVANGSRQIQVDLGTTVPGLAGARLTLAIGEPPPVAAGASPGTTITTAQTRLLLEATIALPAGLGQVKLPIYVEVAPARATLEAIACPWSAPEQLSVAISARPGVVDAAIAQIGPGQLGSGSARPDLTRSAELARLGVITIGGRARATAASAAAQTLTFSRADIDGARARTVGTTGVALSLVSSLLGNLSLEVNGTGPGPAAEAAKAAVLSGLTAALPGLNAALDSALAALGIGIGEADIRVHGARCDRAVLVQ